MAAATTALQSASPAELHGPAGIGKTKLLRNLAHQQFVSGFSDGVVYFSAICHKPVEDLLLDLFDAFYEREATYKPTSVQVRHALQAERALIILDDVDLGRDEVAELMDAAPSFTFLLASTECCLWGEGRVLALRGLPLDDALALVECELGRPLRAEERIPAEALCTALEGHPLRLLQLAALVREDGRSLTDLAAFLQVRNFPAETLTQQALAACSEQEQRILAVLAVPGGASLGKEHVSTITGITDVEPELASLQWRKLVEAHSPRYTLTGSLDETLQEEWDLDPWNEGALEHFTAWAEQQPPERVAEEADAILGIVQRARQAGRWSGALRLGKVVEGALALGGQWGAWAHVLGWQLQAARELGDRAAEAWSLHQSGTQALCLEDTHTAHTALSEALRIRESLGDWEGAAVTRHNLNIFGGAGGDSGQEGNGDDGGGSRWWRPPRLWLGVLALLCALVLLALAASSAFGASLPLATNTILPSLLSAPSLPWASILQTVSDPWAASPEVTQSETKQSDQQSPGVCLTGQQKDGSKCVPVPPTTCPEGQKDGSKCVRDRPPPPPPKPCLSPKILTNGECGDPPSPRIPR